MLLFITHILGSITVGIIFRFWKKNLATRHQYTVSKYDNKLQNITVSNLGEILGISIQSAISTILMIGGFVVLFSVVISILNISGITSLVCILLEPVCHFLGIPSQIIASVFTALTLICVSAMNTFATTLGKSTVVNPDSINNNTVKTGDNSQTIIFIVAGVAVVALAVIIISIIASKKKK